MVETSCGAVATLIEGPTDRVVMFIHSNSTGKEIFANQAGALGSGYGLVAIDLPGHGASERAADPARTYNFVGYAACVAEVIKALPLQQVVLAGSSLGGHVVLQLAGHPAVRGMVISGTPPIGPGVAGLAAGYNTDNPDLALSGQEHLQPEQIVAFADAVRDDGTHDHPLWTAAVGRTHGAARSQLFAAMASDSGPDQMRLVAECPVPLAIINGRADGVVRHAHIESLDYANLWSGRVQYIEGAGHSPFWQAPAAYNALLNRYLTELPPG